MNILDKVYNLTIDIKNIDTKYNSYAKFFDDDRETSVIRIKLLNDKTPMNLENCIVEAYFILADNTYHNEACKIINSSEGVVELQLCQKCLVKGENIVRLSILKDNEISNTPVITYEVRKGLYSDNPSFNDDPLTPILSQMLLDIKVTKVNQIELQERYEKSLPKIEGKIKEVESLINRVDTAIASGTQDLEVKEARVDKNGKSYAKLGDRLNEVDSQLEHKVNKGDLSYFNVKFLGAKGDGITDDTSVLKEAFETYDNIYIPDGEYVFNDTITCVGTKKKNVIQHGTLKYTGNGVAINIRTNFKNPADWQGLKLEGVERGTGILVSANGGWGRNLYLKNFFIKDFGENIRIESGYNITLENGISQTRQVPLFIGVNDGSKVGNTSFSNVLTFNNIYFGGYSDQDKCYSCMVSTCCFDVNMNSCTFEYGEFAISGFSSGYPFNDGATGNPKVNYNNCWFEGLTTLYANYCDNYSSYNNYHVCSYNSLNIYNAFYERITNKYSFKDIYNNSILTNTMFPENQNIREISTNATSLKSMYNQTTLYNYNRTQGIINGKMQLIESYSNKGRRYVLPNNIASVYTGDSTLGTTINITSLNSIASNEKTGLKHILKVYVYATDFNGKYAFKEYKFFEKKENEYVLYGESDVIYDGNKDPIFHIEFTNIDDVVRLNATLTETSIYPKLELNVETVPISSYTI